MKPKARLFLIKKNILISILLIAYLFIHLSLTRNFVFNVQVIKYIPIVLIAIFMFITRESMRFDLTSTIGLIWFLFFTTLFTIVNGFDYGDVVILFGYWVAAYIYFGACDGGLYLEEAIEKSLMIFGLFFLLTTFVYIGDPASYSLIKNQFQGGLDNANAFAGLCGMFLLFFLFLRVKKNNNIFRYLIIISFGVFLLLAASRGAILSVFLAIIIYFFRYINIRNAFFIAFFVLLFLLIGSGLVLGYIDFSLITDREITEDTGRNLIIDDYLNKFSETYFLLGTGVSINAGRFKSELAYLDVILMSGIGAIGFFIYLIRSLYFSVRHSRAIFGWPEILFLYISIVSLVEGYVSNIASILSILFYMLPALFVIKMRNLRYIYKANCC